MAIAYREYVNENGKYREFTNEHGVVQRELIEPSEKFYEKSNANPQRFEAQLRLERNAFLAATDWTVLPDSPLTSDQQSEATQYRQKLRDLPQVYSDVHEARTVLFKLVPENTLSFLK